MSLARMICRGSAWFRFRALPGTGRAVVCTKRIDIRAVDSHRNHAGSSSKPGACSSRGGAGVGASAGAAIGRYVFLRLHCVGLRPGRVDAQRAHDSADTANGARQGGLLSTCVPPRPQAGRCAKPVDCNTKGRLIRPKEKRSE